MVVYDDALENGWQNYGWATLNYANKSPVHSGSDSISVVDPGTSYEALFLGHSAFSLSGYQNLVFWVYTPAAKTNELVVQGTINGNAQTAVYLSFTAGQVNQWQQITIPLTTLGVAENSSFTGFWIQNNTGGPLTFYVDDVSLTATPPPNPVVASVNPLSYVRTVDSRTYGMNIAIWDSYLSGAATNTLLGTMQTGAFRFPGGSASDDYDWQTDESVSNGTFQWVNNAATFAGVTAANGAQAYVTVNYGSGTPEEASAWVAYYNGNASNNATIGVDSKGRNWNTVGYWASIRGAAPLATDDGYNFLRVSHPLPYGIKYWEIGNECYGSWENDLHGTSGSGLTGVAHDPYTYAGAFQTYQTKMQAVDSTIHVGAVASPGEDSYGIGTHPVINPYEGNKQHTGWTPVMLGTMKTLGVTPDFLIDHIYPQNPGSESDAGLLQANSAVASDASNLRMMVTDYVGATSGSSVELAVTELNSVSSNPGKQSTSLVNGLFMADAIGSLANTEFNACLWWALRNGSVTNANNSSSLYGWRLYGDYGVVASGDVSGTPANTPYPTFYAAKLLTNWGRGGDTVVSATSNYALFSLYAARTVDGSLKLLAVNKHPSSDLTTQVTLNGFTPGSTSAATYSYGKPNDKTSSDFTTGTASVSGTFSYTFPSYSMTVLVVKSQFEIWREANFTTTELSNWALSGDTGGPVNDGIPNLTKYALGMSAKVPGTAGLPVTSQTTISGKQYLTLTFTKPIGLTDITYNVQVSGDLKSWQTGAVRVDNGTTNTAVYRDTTAIGNAPRRFMRLNVTRP